MTSIELPAYIDPAVLVPGAHINAVLGDTNADLEVLRIEPVLICRAPDGTEVVVFAHSAVTAENESQSNAPVQMRPKNGTPSRDEGQP